MTMGYGWRRQQLDPRDWPYAVPRSVPAVPVDLRPDMPPVVDQGQLGSCTANAGAGALEYEAGRHGIAMVAPSRLFIYYNERVLENTVASDSGATIRDSMLAMAKQGACPEADWPYDVAKFADRPPAGDYTLGLLDVALQYEAVQQTLATIRAPLQARLAVEYGFVVYDGFENVGPGGMVPMPDQSAQPLGGHANLLVGDVPSLRRFITRNSWGTSWGDGGYGYMPYEYLLNAQLASDFWAIKLVGKS